MNNTLLVEIVIKRLLEMKIDFEYIEKTLELGIQRALNFFKGGCPYDICFQKQNIWGNFIL